MNPRVAVPVFLHNRFNNNNNKKKRNYEIYSKKELKDGCMKKNAGTKKHIYSDFILPHWPKKLF